VVIGPYGVRMELGGRAVNDRPYGMEVFLEIRISELIGAAFGQSRKAVREGAGEVIESGGRGSGKSSYISIEFLLQLLKHPGCNGLVCRKVAATLRTSVFAQLQWAVEIMGLRSRFRFSLSPLEMEYLPTGQRILFFGMDDAGKLKSLKLPRGYVGLLWLEELDQFEAEEVRSVEQSVFRGGEFSLCFKSFNPPVDPNHWVNKLEEKEGRFLHRSNYLQLPESWLGARFLQDAAHLKRVNPTLYGHEYLGLPVGAGDRVFPNLELRAFDAARLRHRVCGVDWGWWPDPWAFAEVSYDPQSRKLYILSEDQAHRCPNRETGGRILAKQVENCLILADAAEPKSIAEYRAMGLNCRAARKGAGSRRYGFKWLQSLNAIVVDPAVCPETAREFAAAVYEKGGYPEHDDHHIDAVRYAASSCWRMGEP